MTQWSDKPYLLVNSKPSYKRKHKLGRVILLVLIIWLGINAVLLVLSYLGGLF